MLIRLEGVASCIRRFCQYLFSITSPSKILNLCKLESLETEIHTTEGQLTNAIKALLSLCQVAACTHMLSYLPVDPLAIVGMNSYVSQGGTAR